MMSETEKEGGREERPFRRGAWQEGEVLTALDPCKDRAKGQAPRLRVDGEQRQALGLCSLSSIY